MELQEIIDLIKTYSPEITDVYLSGSAILPWIQGARDRDMVVETATEGTAEQKRNLKRGFFGKREEYEIDPMYNIVSIVPPIREPLRAWRYENHFLHLAGHGPDIDILTTHRQSYIRGLVYYREHDVVEGKGLYHVLTGIYFLLHNDYTLTEEEIINIQKIHDKTAMDDEYHALKVWAIEKITELEKELQED